MALSWPARLGITAVVAGAVVSLLAARTPEGVLEYMFVESFIARSADYDGHTVMVHGTVVPGSILRKQGSDFDYRFAIEHGGQRLLVHHDDIVPDTFQEGAEVVVTGVYDAGSGVFESQSLSAKCASKYQAEDGGVTKPPGS